MDYCDKLKHYLDDLSENVDLIDEAIATLEGHFELIPENELLHFSRVDAIAYLALKSIVRCKDCDDFIWNSISPNAGTCNKTNRRYSKGWFCPLGQRKE